MLDATYPSHAWWRRAEIPAANGHGNARSVALVQSVVAGKGEARGVRLLSEAGCDRIFDEQIHGTDLVGAVRALAAGESILDPEAASRVMKRMRDQATRSDPLTGLTTQERRILELIGEGLTNRQIGERLFLAEKTVKNYVSALFAKLGMQRRTQAAAFAARIFDGGDKVRG